jgi:purine nucleoside phosphorylase
MAETMIGVIGGSGVYEIDGLEDAQWRAIETPWGDPSDELLTGRLNGLPIAFLPRHGRGHVHTPTSVPYRANIDALKQLGVTDVIAVSACGSFRHEMKPGDFVIVDQFIDRTFARDQKLFRPRLRRPCERGAPHLPPAWRDLCRGRARGRCHRARGRHVSRHGRPAVFHAGRIEDVSRKLELRM